MIMMDNKEVNKANTLVCKAAEGLIFINHDDIICLMADGHYTEVFVVDQENSLRVMDNISSLNLVLPQDRFFQCHRSYIINTGQIVSYRKKCKELVMKNEKIVPVSRSNEKGLLQRCH